MHPKTRGVLAIAAMLGALPPELARATHAGRAQYPHRELTTQDVERIEAAQAKRARRAAKRRK